MHDPSSTLPRLIGDLQAEIRRSTRRSHLHELARQRIDAPHEIIDWAKRDRRWSFTLAEIMNEPVACRASAARLLVAIVDELEQEREAFGDTTRRKRGNQSRDARGLSVFVSEMSTNRASAHFSSKFLRRPETRRISFVMKMNTTGRKTVKGRRFRRRR